MKKDRILVHDKKGNFLKMFKRKLKVEFDFYTTSLFVTENQSNDFDYSIFVIYDKTELIEYLKCDKKDSNNLLCLFDKRLFSSLNLLEGIKNLILIDDSKTRKEVIKELKLHFENDFENEEQQKSVFTNSTVHQNQFQNLYKALYLLA